MTEAKLPSGCGGARYRRGREAAADNLREIRLRAPSGNDSGRRSRRRNDSGRNPDLRAKAGRADGMHMKPSFQTTLREPYRRVRRHRRSLRQARPPRPQSRRSRYRPGVPAQRPPQWRQPPHRGQLVQSDHDRTLHRHRRRRTAHGRHHRTSGRRPARPRGRQLPGRGRRPGSADHGRLGRGLRRGDRSRRRPPARRAAPLHQDSEDRSASNMAAPSPNCGPRESGFRLDVEIDFKSDVDRPPAQDSRSRRRPPSAANWRARAPSASSRTSSD